LLCQAEDGIRDYKVTGVQTCALPISSPDVMPVLVHLGPAACCGLVRYESEVFGPEYRDNLFASSFNLHKVTRHALKPDGATFDEIGRASCREKGEKLGGGG